MEDKLQQFLDKKHINLETYRKSGEAVKTPVWFVIYNDIIHVITRESTGKVKRLKNNPVVKTVPCSFNGNPDGEWVSGSVKMLQGDDAKKIIKLRKKKYGFKALLSGIVTKSKGELIVYSISLD